MQTSADLVDAFRRLIARRLTEASTTVRDAVSTQIISVSAKLGRSANDLSDAASAVGARILRQAPEASGGPTESGVTATLIEQRSAELGLRTPAQHAMESSLFIDAPLHEVALLRGQPRPGELFGTDRWAGYLESRAFARRYGDQELTVPFITELHKRSARFSKQGIGGVLAYNSRYGPLLVGLSDREKAIIDQNQFVRHAPAGSILPHNEAISYEVSSPAEARSAMASLCDRYNEARLQPGTDPYRLAAELQQEYVSIHPWQDYNGGTSRLLMNWSLENSGLPPSVLPDFTRDILSTPAEWTDTVRSGSEIYAERAARLDDLGPDSNPIEVFGLENEYQIYQEIELPMEPLRNGAEHNIAIYRADMDDVRNLLP